MEGAVCTEGVIETPKSPTLQCSGGAARDAATDACNREGVGPYRNPIPAVDTAHASGMSQHDVMRAENLVQFDSLAKGVRSERPERVVRRVEM